jgi:hypothetical protein
MRLLSPRFDAEIRVARALFLLASAACRGLPAPEREGRRRRRTSEGGFPLGCLRLFWSRSDDVDGGARQQGDHGSRRLC